MNINHVAIIPDGNRRWAKERGLHTVEGHRRGFEAMKKIAKRLRERGVQTLTVWAFSTENWKRSQEEVSHLMRIYEIWFKDNLKAALKDKARIIHLGRKDRINASLARVIENVEEKTKHFDTYYLGIALDYGGRDEIVRALNKIQDSKSKIRNEDDFEQFLDTKDLPHPHPDIVIRTSGEYRTSGFMTWQSAYSEYVFSSKYLPDFTPKDLDVCLDEYLQRQRRFGK